MVSWWSAAGPALAVQEPPGEELAGLRRQPVQMAAGQVHRDDPSGLGHDRGAIPTLPEYDRKLRVFEDSEGEGTEK